MPQALGSIPSTVGCRVGEGEKKPRKGKKAGGGPGAEGRTGEDGGDVIKNRFK